MPDLSKLPSVDHLLQEAQGKELLESFGHPMTVSAFRQILDDLRSQIIKGESLLSETAIHEKARNLLEEWTEPTLLPVINATGVVLHTNLGRAPLSKATLKAIFEAAGAYSNLEFNLANGKRGQRSVHAAQLLTRLTGAEGGFVVNNNAGAVLLVLSALARGKKVIVSRTQLVEIGGGFRIPDVMRQSGAHLLEIGTTNRVHLHDFETALDEDKIALVLIAHHSNFKMIGFHSEPALSEIVEVAHRHDVPVVHDLGSGALLDTEKYGLAHEPTVFESLEAGCDLVCFSGDKLLGGPQAGMIIGSELLLAPIRKHPLARALRADKLTLAGVSANLVHYLKNEAEREVPIWQMISKPLSQIRTTAENWVDYLGQGEVLSSFSTVGGGSLPTEEMPTFVLSLSFQKPDSFLRSLRDSHPPIIARIENDRVLLDPRTVFPEQEGSLIRNLLRILENPEV